MYQSADAWLSYADIMKIALAQLRLLLAVILLIAGGAVAGFAGQASAIGANSGVATLSTSATHQVIGHIASTDQDDHGAACDDCLDCLHSTGPSCCAACISAVECAVLDDVPVAVRFVAGKAFLATGIDPEALLQPPRTFA
ncbi:MULTISPECIES: hypothetical protein [unclassified Mesorhizobium]|uniref:hypothetical protein n=2 Tax=Mesorhizobium TaxID=68287 RepID=UPI000FC9A609|nr:MULTISPECIES: hypothetical protein [unclassified Mesorhizobium]RUV50811.1 hypothetical protein EOA85_30490 [Mesorhizobium sp. M5C.F.Ca.IN.020.29.1.1]RWB97320.1 MAG: hypothetical protein EOQ56_23385 [Mesorhizobium sp.]RWI18561.1 MAG: hypothetical protein EOQ92_22530 [Mesorhizobium sp.]RWK45215.1 MAG: hypothetical protein EOR47_32025 [Mesorhizobium sp.]RWK53563.1 MAG: hypothetical protein EOR48_21585 [Mesorhizobium sp.]